jgi:hypothetical protein
MMKRDSNRESAVVHPGLIGNGGNAIDVSSTILRRAAKIGANRLLSGLRKHRGPHLVLRVREHSAPFVFLCGVLAAAAFSPLAQADATNTLPADVQPCVLPPVPAPVLAAKSPGTAWFAPSAPVYPYPDDPARITAQAQCLSDAFATYIRAWLDGRVPAEVPDAFIPPGINRQTLRRFTLVVPENISAAEQWGVRPAGPIDFAHLKHSFPDPNVTYLLMPGMWVPFGTRVVIDGEFPHSRFFDLQVTPSLDPRSYRYDGGIGVGEVPIVDADIEPLAGHINPFRVGANRNAAQRGYRVVFRMAAGDPVALNPAFRPPYFRGRGNERVGSGLVFQGPWGAIKGFGHGRGIWGSGEIWGRYYLPDASRGPLAGVALPKVTYVLPDGRRFFIRVDSGSLFDLANRTFPLKPNDPVEPSTRPTAFGAQAQWSKQTGIFRALLTGIAVNTPWGGMDYVRQLDRGVAGRGADMAPPNNYEQSATSATYVDYLGRGMSLGQGKIAVLTGRLPTFPATRAGDARMRAAQMRYWSIVGYEVPIGWDFARAMLNPAARPGGLAVHEILDEDIVLDSQRRYVIVLSRPEDRPANATAANGVTWVDWGPSAAVAWTLRWLTVGPEWTGPMAPTPALLGRRADLAEPAYDPRALANNHRGALGDYLPRVESLTSPRHESGLEPETDRRDWERFMLTLVVQRAAMNDCIRSGAQALAQAP